MKKILHVCLACFFIDDYSYQENILPYYHYCDGNDVKVIASLFTFDKDGSGMYFDKARDYISNYGYSVSRLAYKSEKSISKILRLYNGLYKSICDFMPDVIFVHGCQFFDIRYIIKYKKYNSNVKIYIDNHADLINSINSLGTTISHKTIWKYCAKSVLPYVEKFYGVTPNRCDFLHDVYGIPKDKIELLVMGADSRNIDFDNQQYIRANIRKNLGIDNDDFVIITGGKIDRQKDIHILMEAVRRINNTSIKLIVFGNTSVEMKDEISLLSQHKCISNIGWLSSENIYNYFLSSDLAVFPGTHSVLWEQACGTGIPCVFKMWRGMEHVNLGGNALLLDIVDVDLLIETITNIYDNKELYNNMKKIASEKAIPYFSYVDIARRSIN